MSRAVPPNNDAYYGKVVTPPDDTTPEQMKRGKWFRLRRTRASATAPTRDKEPASKSQTRTVKAWLIKMPDKNMPEPKVRELLRRATLDTLLQIRSTSEVKMFIPDSSRVRRAVSTSAMLLTTRPAPTRWLSMRERQPPSWAEIQQGLASVEADTIILVCYASVANVIFEACEIHAGLAPGIPRCVEIPVIT